jgi:hypothetical protein
MKKIILTVGFTFAFATGLLAQQLSVKGLVLDSATRQPIPYATVRCPELLKTSAANILGEFEILVGLKNQIFVSCVGYKSKSFSADDTDLITVYLSPAVTEIHEVVVFASKPSEQAKKIVKKAFEHLSKQTGSFTANVDLRHTVKQDHKYVKMLDAQLAFRDDKKYQGNVRPEFVQEELTYLQKRESLDLATDRADFQRTYFDFYHNDFAFLLKNGLKYALTSRDYDYFLEGTTESEHEISYQISAFDKSSANKTFTETFDITYEIYVNKSTEEHFIKSYELNYRSLAVRKFLRHTENSFFKIQLQKAGESYIPENIEHFLMQTTQYDSMSKPSQVEAFHYLTFTPAATTKSKPVKNIQYMPEYWKDKPIDSQTQKDLSIYIDLEKQFSLQHILAEKTANQEKVSKTIIDKYIADNKDHNVYLVLWNKPEDIISFITCPDFIDHRKTRPVFIGSIESQRNWAFIIEGNGTMFYPQFNLPTLIAGYVPAGTKPPAYILIKKSGERLHQINPLDKKHLE